jgi:octaprenyl-diphosphate synthase
MVKEIQALVADDFTRLNAAVVRQLKSQVELIENIGQYIIEAGGKRVRPLLVLLISRALAYNGNQHIDLATVIEFLHTATLLHDDVVDTSEMRRGRPTANQHWGNPSSVLVGDFIYSRAFQLLVSIGSMPIMEVMATTTNQISEGEVLQLIHQRDPKTTAEQYYRVIHNKTAILFAAACSTAAILAGASEAQVRKIYKYGLEIGMAFQLVDDVLDYDGSVEELGKNIGDDLAEGKPTLPLIYAMQNGSSAQRKLIESAILEGGLDKLDAIIHAVRSTGALDFTRAEAGRRIALALESLSEMPDSPYLKGLQMVADLALNRRG